MKRLVIDTATRACSVALFDGNRLLASHYEEIGRGHAEHLVPMIAKLPDRGRADSIHVNVGPGSFTGIRVGIAAARALALAWNAECFGYTSLSLIAAMARDRQTEPTSVDAVLPGGHGELFFQSFDAGGISISDPESISPLAVQTKSNGRYLVGDVVRSQVEFQTMPTIMILPDASQWPLLSKYANVPVAPLYVRAPDAKLPAPR